MSTKGPYSSNIEIAKETLKIPVPNIEFSSWIQEEVIKLPSKLCGISTKCDVNGKCGSM